MSQRRSDKTPLGIIKSGFRGIWLRSRERSQALKDALHCCESCGAKGRAKATRNGPAVTLHVHHRDGIDWDGLAELFRRRVLPPADRLQVLCKSCHEQVHKEQRHV